MGDSKPLGAYPSRRRSRKIDAHATKAQEPEHMAHRSLSAHAKSLAALGVSSVALIAATPANQANQALMAGDGTLALVSPHEEPAYKAAQAEGLGNVVDDRGYKSAASEGWGNVVG